MNLAAIPAELKTRPQWVVWRSVIGQNARGETIVTKPPFQPRNLQFGANTTDPRTWGTFEEAVACLQSNPSIAEGIGFVFTEEDDFYGVDIDDENKVDPDLRLMRNELVSKIVGNSKSYAETSPSGRGLHIIAKGSIPMEGRRSQKLQLEVYGSKRYFTITGDVYNGRSEIVEEQDMANWLFADFLAQANDNSGGPLVDVDVHRRLDMSDEEVIQAANNFSPSFAPRFNAQIGCEPGEWSETFIAVIGVLDQITGKVDQIQRIVLGSPMVLQAPNAGNGETRLSKAQRNFNHVLGRVRGNNTGFLQQVAHGRSIMTAIREKREREAKELAERILAKAEGAFSKNGVEMLKAFPLDPRFLDLAPPPGLVGEYVKATLDYCANPFLKFSLPSTLSALCGIVARSYKLPSGSGLNANFVLAAPTSTGKTQTMDAWEDYLTRAASAIGNTVSGPARNRIIKASAASIQGIYPDFMDMPSCVWFISECASQLKQMSEPKSSTDTQLRDAYNDLYDVSKIGRMFSPPRSVASNKANLEPIPNLSVTTYWTTTTSKFDVFNDDAADGFLSRVIVIRHDGPAGEAVPDWDLKKHLPDELHQRLVTQMSLAKAYDERYQIEPGSAYQFTTVVSTEGVEAHGWAFRQIAERIKNAALSKAMPIGYVAVARLPMTAMRLAGMLAVIENPYTPSITVEQYEWAFGYLLQNLAALLSDMDHGEVGSHMSRDMDVAVREIKRMMRKAKSHGVKKGELVHELRLRKPFKDAISPGDAVRRTLLDMVSNELLDEVSIPVSGRGRPAAMYCPTDAAIWSS